ncbi:CDP-diacylglycerol-serine O-phosphatidyltransferase [Savitreella phatthalungensis]
MVTVKRPLQAGKEAEAKLIEYVTSTGHFSLLRNLHVADYITLVNGASGLLSILSSVRYARNVTALITAQSYHQLSRPLPGSLTSHLSLGAPSSGGLVSWEYESMCARYAYWSILWIVIGTVADVLDGKVARWRRRSSLIGQELDSLADLVSFGVAPATLAFCLGLDTRVDAIMLAFFVVCGLTRLARFNVTVGSMHKDKTGKIAAFEGTPIPTSLILTAALGLAVYLGYTDPTIPSRHPQLNTAGLGGGIADLVAANLSRSGFLPNIPGGLVGSISSPFSFHPATLLFAALGCAMASKTLRIPKL